MEISDFIADRTRIQDWLNQEMALLNQRRIYAAYWFHPEPGGFGVVIVDANSGEFHLSGDGRVTTHVERGSRVVHSAVDEVADLHSLFTRFADFKSRILLTAGA